MDYYLEIETENRLKIIKNPRKARAKDIILRSIVSVMDGKGRWHFIGHCFYVSDAEKAADNINNAIKNKRESVCLELQ